MKKFFFSLVVLSVASLFIASTNTFAQKQTGKDVIKLRVADSFPLTHFMSVHGIQYWMKKVEEYTNGKVKCQHFPAGQLGKSTELFNVVCSGMADVAYIATPYTVGKTPFASGLGSLPMVYENARIGSWAYWKTLSSDPVLHHDFLKFGLRPVLAWVTPGYEIFTSKKVIRVPEDVKGLKIRGPGGLLDKTEQAVGAVPVYIPAPEIYQSLQRGVIDAVAFSYGSAKAYKINELVNQATSGLNFPGGGLALAIREEVYRKMEGNIKNAIKKASDETVKHLADFIEKDNESIKQEFIKKGMKIYKLTSQDQEKWKNLIQVVKDEWVNEMEKKGFAARQALDNYLKEIEKAREIF